MSDEIEQLPCFGGPLDGDRMSSVGFPDVQPWGNHGLYIRTPARYIRAIGLDPMNPLSNLVSDGWVWRRIEGPTDEAARTIGGKAV